ncbi:MAG: tRNA (adenosine(37)-N6)-threonylcarbamoyltransferase complex ATPase subunit type 1 TsaE, partial [bacterium]
IKGVCAGLGYQGRVLSPTFQLVREYKIIQKPRSKNQDIILKIYHADLYRLERRTEIETIGLGDYLADKEAVVLLEWAERLAPKRLPKPRTEIKIEIVSENVRKFDILNV